MKHYELILQTKERLARSFYSKAYIMTCNQEFKSLDKFDCLNCTFSHDKAMQHYNALTVADIVADIPTASTEDLRISVYEYDYKTDSRREVCTRCIGEEF